MRSVLLAASLLAVGFSAVGAEWYEDSLSEGFKRIEPLPISQTFRVQPSTGRYRLGAMSDDGKRECYKWIRWDLRKEDVVGKTLCVAFKARGEGTAYIDQDRCSPRRGVYQHGGTLLPYRDMPFRAFIGPYASNVTSVAVGVTVDGHMDMETPVFLVKDGKLDLSKRIDDPSVRDSKGQLPNGYAEGRRLKLPPDEADLALFADSYSLGLLPSRLAMATDGSMGTHERGPFVLSFPTAVTMTGFRWTIPKRGMELYADTDGDGKFETDVFRKWDALPFSTWKDAREYIWFVHRLKKPVKLHRLLVVGGAHEFELLGPASELARLPKPSSCVPAKRALTVGAPLGKQPDAPSDRDRLWYGFTLEPWMFGIEGKMSDFYKKGKPVGDVADWPSWQKIAKDFHELDANFVLLFPPHSWSMPPGVKRRPGVAYPFPLLWPSEVWYCNQTNDILRSFNAACHKEGFKSFVIPRSWEFNTNKTATVKQVTFAKEIAERGADGVPMCVDEQFFSLKADFWGKSAESEKVRTDFFKWSGQTNLPAWAYFGDTLATRLGYLYSAKKTAEWMAQIKDEQLRHAPNALTFGGFGGCDHWQERVTGYVSGADYWGWEGKCDVIGGDGTYFGVGVDAQGSNLGTLTPAVQTAVQVSCTPKRLSMATVNFNWGTRWNRKENRLKNPLVYDDFPNMAHTAGALATYFNKGTHLNFWRYNFMDENGGPNCRKAVKRGGYMTKVLGAWGGKSAEVPKDVLVLRSRVAEDWWALRRGYGKKFASEGARKASNWGHHLFFWTAARLAECAMPFEIYQLQRVEAWKDIAANYKVIVLPFSYSVSDAEIAALKAAAARGVKIVVVGGAEAGMADGLGEMRKRNAFAGLPVSRFEIASPDVPSTKALAAQFAKFMRGLVGSPSLSLEKLANHDVQAFMLSVSEREKLLMVANWSERNMWANLSVALPRGSYALEVCDGECVREGMIGEKKTFGPEDAHDIRLDLKREDVLLMRIRPSSALNPKNWF